MSFQTFLQDLKTLNEQGISPDSVFSKIKEFNALCKENFPDSFDLSKGDPQDFIAIMEIITIFHSQTDEEVMNRGDEELWIYLSKVALALLMLKESNTFADATLKFNDKNKLAWYHKGKFFEKERDFKEAEKCFNKAKEIDPDYYQAWYQIASMYEKIDLESAVKKYLEIVDKFPRSMSGWKRLEEVGGKLGGKYYEVAMRAQKVSFELSSDPDRKM